MVIQSTIRKFFRSKKAGIVLSLLTCLPAIFLFMAVSLYNHPIGDDFWCTAMVKKYGYWNAQLRLYDIVPPRYFELALSCLTPLSFGNFSGYKLIPILFILLFIYVVTGLLRTLAGPVKGSYGENALKATLFVSLYLSVMPGIAEGIYWASALSVYHSGIILFVIWCNYTLKWFYLKRKPIYALVVCLCLAGMMGCNELISIIALMVLFAILLYGLALKKGINSLLLSELLILVGCLVFVFQFSGSANRYSLIKTEGSGRLLYSMGYSLVINGYYIGRCLVNPFFWAAIICSRMLFKDPGANLFFRSFLNFRVIYIVIWCSILFIIPFAIIYITGERPPLRICNMIVFFFLFGMIGPAVYMLRSMKAGRLVPAAIVILIAGGFMFKNNVSLAARDLFSGNAARYDRDWNRRYELISACREDTCTVPRLEQIPFVFWFQPDVTEPHISEYFNKHIIVAQGSSIFIKKDSR